MEDQLVFRQKVKACIFREANFLSNINCTGHKQGALDTKLGGHFILKAANDYS